MATEREKLVIAVGGSLLIPDTIDISFITHLKEMVRHMTTLGYQIILIIGGGKTSRNYSKAAQEFRNITDTDLDWIGIQAIALNCEFIRRVFSDHNIYPNPVSKNEDISAIKNDVVIVGAWEPGHSSDYNAVDIAERVGARRVINFSNISHVYDTDPKENPLAQKLNTLSWDEYQQLIPREWVSNMSAPFDPIASQKAKELSLTVIILGASIDNLVLYLEQKNFEGTVIS